MALPLLYEIANLIILDRKRGNGKENISFFPTQQLCVYEKNGERKTGVHDSPGRIFVHRLNTSRRARQGSLDGWMGLSVALPKVAADDYPVLRERPLLRSPPCKKAIPKDAGASGKPLPMPAGMAPAPHTRRCNPPGEGWGGDRKSLPQRGAPSAPRERKAPAHTRRYGVPVPCAHRRVKQIPKGSLTLWSH